MLCLPTMSHMFGRLSRSRLLHCGPIIRSNHDFAACHCIRRLSSDVGGFDGAEDGVRDLKVKSFKYLNLENQTLFDVVDRRPPRTRSVYDAFELSHSIFILAKSGLQYNDVDYQLFMLDFASSVVSLPPQLVGIVRDGFFEWLQDGYPASRADLLRILDKLFCSWLESRRELNQCDVEEALEVSKLWYTVNHGKDCCFNQKLIAAVADQGLLLDHSNFVKLLFHINITRTPLTHKAAALLQKTVLILMEELSLDEIAVFCDAFFKTSTRSIDKSIVEKIYDRLLAEDALAAVKHDVVITALTKGLRSSLYIPDKSKVRHLYQIFCNNPRILTNYSAAQVCSLMMFYKVCSPKLLEISYQRLIRNIRNIRIKDMDKVTEAMALFDCNCIPERDVDALETALLSNPAHYRRFTHNFLSTVVNLVSLRIYPARLMDECLKQDFVDTILKRKFSDYLHLLVVLNTSLALECAPEYCSRLLKPEVLNSIRIDRISAEELTSTTRRKQMSSKDRHLLECYTRLKQKLGNRVILRHLLPFSYHPEIVVIDHKSDEDQWDCLSMEPNSVCNIPVVVLQHKTRFQYLKERLLKKLGFTVIGIHFAESSKVDKVMKQLNLKKDYLAKENKIS